FFFFQAEDGIRDRNVTGVQTCALPISVSEADRVFDALASASIPTDDAYALCLRWEAAVESACKLLVGVLSRPGPIGERIDEWRRALTELADRFAGEVAAEADAAVTRLERLGIEPGIARSLHALERLRGELEIVRVAEDRR